MTDLRALVRDAIGTEWHQRIADQTADTPDGHIDALTNAVVERLTVPDGIIRVDPGRISEDDARRLRDASAGLRGRPSWVYPIEPYEIDAPARPRWRWWHRFRRSGASG